MRLGRDLDRKWFCDGVNGWVPTCESSILQIDLILNSIVFPNPPVPFIENLLGYEPHHLLLFQACEYGFVWIYLDRNSRFQIMSKLLGCREMLELKLARRITHAILFKR